MSNKGHPTGCRASHGKSLTTAAVCCCVTPVPPWRRAAFFRFIALCLLVELSESLSKYRFFSGSIIVFCNRTIHRNYRYDIEHNMAHVIRFLPVTLCLDFIMASEVRTCLFVVFRRKL